MSKCVFDAHSKLNHAAQACKLQVASEHILRNQNKALSTYLLMMTRSDKVSGIPQHTGG